jgi:hypothetical protein
MNKEILSEINRYREIIGLPILTEGKIPATFFSDLVSNFAKRDTDDLAEAIAKREITQMNDIFDDLARKYPKKTFEQLVEDFRLNRLTSTQEDSLIARFLKYGDAKVQQTVIKNFIDSSPSIKKIITTFTKNVDGTFKKLTIADGTSIPADDFVRALQNQGNLENYLKDQDALINLSGFGSEMKNYLKKQLRNSVTDILSTPKGVKQIGIDDVYDTMKDLYKGKVFPSKQTLKGLEDELVTAGITKQELIQKIVDDYATNKEGLVNQAKKWIGLGGEIGKAGQAIVEGSGDTIKKTFNGWRFGAVVLVLLTLGITFRKQAKGVYQDIFGGELKDVWVDIYKESFRNLPEELQSKITSTYDSGQATTDSNKLNGVKSFDWNEGSETLVVNFFDGNKDTWKKVQSGDQTYWAVEGGTLKKYEEESAVKKTEEEFKTAAKNAGFDIGKSFVKQTDTKYWGVDNDDSKSTTEWNGTTFIVSAEHI